MNHEKEQSLYGDHHTNAGTVFHLSHIFLFKGDLLQLYRLEGIRNLGFVGLTNYLKLWGDEAIGDAYKFTFKYAICATILVNVISLLLALALNAKDQMQKCTEGCLFPALYAECIDRQLCVQLHFFQCTARPGQKMGIGFLSTNILGQENLAWIGILVVEYGRQ